MSACLGRDVVGGQVGMRAAGLVLANPLQQQADRHPARLEEVVELRHPARPALPAGQLLPEGGLVLELGSRDVQADLVEPAAPAVRPGSGLRRVSLTVVHGAAERLATARTQADVLATDPLHDRAEIHGGLDLAAQVLDRQVDVPTARVVLAAQALDPQVGVLLRHQQRHELGVLGCAG